MKNIPKTVSYTITTSTGQDFVSNISAEKAHANIIELIKGQGKWLFVDGTHKTESVTLDEIANAKDITVTDELMGG